MHRFSCGQWNGSKAGQFASTKKLTYKLISQYKPGMPFMFQTNLLVYETKKGFIIFSANTLFIVCGQT